MDEMRYCDDPKAIDEIELMLGEYMAGGFGDLKENPRLKALLDEAERYATEALDEGREVAYPEEFVHRYFERKDSEGIDY